MSTKLDPMTEHLFQAWARAHGVQDHDSPKNSFDYRGLYQQSQGRIMPGHAVRQMAMEHNAAANAKEGPATQSPDPFAAAAQMHGDKLKAQSDHAKEANKILLEREKMKHKLLVEHMKLSHKSQESEKDRQHKTQLGTQSAQIDLAKHHLDRQAQVQDMHQQRQFAVQDQQNQRVQQVQDQQADRAHAMQDAHLKNHFAMQQAKAKASPLETQLMNRHAGPTSPSR
jgi:hypothetical protein